MADIEKNQSEKPSDSKAALEPASDRIIISSRKTLSRQWTHLESVDLKYKRRDGQWQSQRREIYHRDHGAAVLLYNIALRTIVLIRQFRFPVWDSEEEGFIIEVPAGLVETGDPEATIRNEVLEETGFIIDKPQLLFRAYSTPGAVTEQVHYFCASYSADQRIGTGGGAPDEGEDIEVLEVSFEKAADWMSSGKIIDAKTIMLIQYAQMHIFNE